MPRSIRYAFVAAVLGALVVSATSPALAHVEKTVGKYKFVVGWGDEPTYAGFRNSVQLILSDSNGKPVTDLGDSLKVTVVFSGQTVIPTRARGLRATIGLSSSRLVPGTTRSISPGRSTGRKSSRASRLRRQRSTRSRTRRK